MGPFYAHFYRDAAPGFDLRTRFPLADGSSELTVMTILMPALTHNHYTV